MLSGFFLLAMTLNAGASLPADPPMPNVAEVAPTQESDAQQIATLLERQYASWDARDFDGYMAFFWRSPRLVYITEESVWLGWEQVRANVERQYPNKSAM